MSLRLAATAGTAQTVVSMVLSFVSVKITSVYLGPAGLGTVGQLGYFMAMTVAILAAGPNIGLVRRVCRARRRSRRARPGRLDDPARPARDRRAGGRSRS